MIEHDVSMQFETILDQNYRMKEEELASSKPSIPTFYRPKPKADSLLSLVKRHARSRKEQLKQEISDDQPLRQIGYLVEEYGIFAADSEDEIKLNYDAFTQVASRCREIFGPSLGCLFKASVFQMFAKDDDGCISAHHFLVYLSLRSAMIHMRVHLSVFDPDNSGFLSVTQLEDFLAHYAKTVPSLEEMPDSFMPLYKKIAARKLMLFHGHNNTVRIRELLSSQMLGELSDLKIPGQTEEQLLGSWFSLQSTQRVHNTFLRLDEFYHGSLSISEFSQISGSTMSTLFLRRIFEEHVGMKKGPQSSRDRMNLQEFTDFVLAWDHRSNPAAIKYFFPIFDIKKQGFITPHELYIFFKEIHVMWVQVLGEYSDLSIFDVIDEFIDMVKPKDSPNIRPEDLRECGMSGTFFSCLADAKQFQTYNYRENQMHQSNNDEL